MKNIQSGIIVGIITFSLSLYVTALFLFLSPSKMRNSSIDSISKLERTDLPNDIAIDSIYNPPVKEIQFLGFTKGSNSAIARFKINNLYDESLSYTGYSNGDTCNYNLIKDGKRINQRNCGCGTGLEKRFIPAKSSEVFEISIPYHIVDNFLVQFTFLLGKSNKEVILIKNIE